MSSLRRSPRIRKREEKKHNDEETQDVPRFRRYDKSNILCKSELKRIQEESTLIGSGTFGEVRRLGDIVIKTMKIAEFDESMEGSLMDPNMKEICFLAQYSHQFISNIQCVIPPAIFEDNSYTTQLMMKYSGLPLNDLINPQQHITTILYQCLLLLAQMEQLNLTHGDLKPRNILFDSENSQQITFIDWGTITLLAPNRRPSSMQEGTSGFVAPELTIDSMHTPLIDVFAVGMAILYLYTRTYYKQADLENLYEQKYGRINEVDTIDAPPYIRNILEKMISINPEERMYASELLKTFPIKELHVNATTLRKWRSYQFRIRELGAINPDYESRYEDINLTMREILIQWLWSVCRRERKQNAFVLCCYLIDLYFTYNEDDFKRTQLQLLGVVCLYLATVMIQKFPLDMHTIRQVAANTFSQTQFISMTIRVLNQLNYIVYKPTFDILIPETDAWKFDLLLVLMLDRKSIGQNDEHYLTLYETLRDNPSQAKQYVTIVKEELIPSQFE